MHHLFPSHLLKLIDFDFSISLILISVIPPVASTSSHQPAGGNVAKQELTVLQLLEKQISTVISSKSQTEKVEVPIKGRGREHRRKLQAEKEKSTVNTMPERILKKKNVKLPSLENKKVEPEKPEVNMIAKDGSKNKENKQKEVSAETQVGSRIF